MSNLSELLPAGAGAKSAKFVASGTLASGVTVALKSNGQVEAVALAAEVVGTPVVFQASARSDWPTCAYDPNTNKVLIFYYKTTSTQLWGVVGTVSGSTLSFGTPLLVVSGFNVSEAVGCLYDPVSQNIVYAYRDIYAPGPKVIIATVSGTSFTFGSPTGVDTGNVQGGASMVYDTNANKILFAYRDPGNSNYGTGRVGTVSGQTISFGTKTVFKSVVAEFSAMAYDSVAQKIVLMYRNGTEGLAQVATISGTGVSFGATVQLGSASGAFMLASGCAYDVSSNKTVLGYAAAAPGKNGIALTASISGTSLTLGTNVTFAATAIQSPMRLVYDANAQKVIAIYSDLTNSYSGRLNPLSVSGSTITVGTQVIFKATTISYPFAAYDSTAKKTIIAFADATTDGEAVVYSPSATNYTDFLGITDEAIANTASGSVIVQGGAITNTNLTVSPAVITVGSKVVFDDAGPTTSISSAYDSDNGKIVHVFCTTTAHAIVGTVSGTSITYGSAVQINTDSSSNTSVAYDTANNKFVIAYRGASNYGYAVVGTVSGTSISFGTPVVFYSGSVGKISVVYDTNAGKTLIMHTTGDSSTDIPTGIVGTVSGTSISFGSPTAASSNRFFQLVAAYDANAQKTVVVGADYSGTSGAAFVATISSTSVSFGSAATFLAEAVEANALAITYDSTQNKVIVVYGRDSNDYGYYTIGTVSGTSVSFTTGVEFIGNGSNYYSAAYDSVKELVGVTYNSWSSSDVRFITGSVSGASISFNASNQLATSATDTSSATYDVASGNFIGSYGDGSNNSDGTSNVVLVVTSLTIGTDYFVQGDGTLSTTSSTVPAGRALSTTSMLLEG